MELSASLVSTGIWLFLFRKIPSWGWFKSLRKRLPKSLNLLWDGWTECAYCGGFWIALAVRWSTELNTIQFPHRTPAGLDWILDALATAVGVLLCVRILDALAAVILNGEKEK